MTRVKTYNKKDAIDSLLIHRIGKTTSDLAEKIEKKQQCIIHKKERGAVHSGRSAGKYLSSHQWADKAVSTQ